MAENNIITSLDGQEVALLDVSTDTRPNSYTKVDKLFYAPISLWKWKTNDKGYVVRDQTINGKTTRLYLHRWLLGINHIPDVEVDHINGDTLDNRLENLRLASKQQNARNRRQAAHKKYKGVYRNSNCSTFSARINPGSGPIYLGGFPSEEAAAEAYDLAAVKYHGDFAKLNFPDKLEEYKKSLT